MKLKLSFILLLCLNTILYAQHTFEEGYLIRNDGSRISCLIKNEDWRENPQSFIYKLNENGDTKIGNLSSVKEFGSGEYFRYIRATVDIDQSSDKVNNLSYERNPIMKEQTLFLKVLAQGKASLFYSDRENLRRYFYSIDGGEIEQLIYKPYMASVTKLAKNERYKQQLANHLDCSTWDLSRFEKLEYKKNSLLKLIKDYNQCKNSETVVYGGNRSSGSFHLNFRPGVAFGQLSISPQGKEKLDFGNKTGIRIGLEAEYIMPFNNGKWAIFIEPTYRNYKAEKEVVYKEFTTIQRTTLVTAQYNSIEFPLGGRHYMFLGPEAAIFINAAVIVDLSTLDSKIESSTEASYDLEVDADAALGLGLGFKYKNRYSVEARYHSSRKIVNYVNIGSSYTSFSLIFGYSLF